MQRYRFLLISFCHFNVDTYATLLPPLLPLVNERLDISLTQAGLLGSVLYGVSMVQPVMGWLGDRMRRRYLVIVGALMAAIFTPTMGLVPSYGTLMAVLTIGALGVHVFHPQGFAMAGELSGNRRAFGIALFSFAGTIALGLTAIWAPMYVHAFGFEALALLAIPGLAITALVYRLLPLDNPHLNEHRRLPRLRETLGPHAGRLGLVTAIVTLRWVASSNFSFFLALLAYDRGMSLAEGGFLLAVFNVAGVVGSLCIGYLADRMRPEPLIWGSIALAAPALYGFLVTDGHAAMALLAVGGFAIMATNSVLVAIAQEMAPENAGFASSLPLGFAWGAAGLTLTLTGWWADRIGVETMLKYVCLVPLFTAGLAMFLRLSPHGKDQT